jgi:hypothetical protein
VVAEVVTLAAVVAIISDKLHVAEVATTTAATKITLQTLTLVTVM